MDAESEAVPARIYCGGPSQTEVVDRVPAPHDAPIRTGVTNATLESHADLTSRQSGGRALDAGRLGID